METQLEPTWGRVIRVWWSLTWRNVVVTIGVMFCAGLVGVLFGVACALAGGNIADYVWPLRIFGGLMGLAASTIPVKWILGSRLGRYRLVLVASGEAAASASRPAGPADPHSVEPPAPPVIG